MKLFKVFILTMSFFFLLTFAFYNRGAFAEKSANWKQEVQMINDQLEELEEMKRGYEARVLRYENQAQRLQFDPNELLTARRYWRLADENRKKVREIESRIHILETKKENIIKSHTHAENNKE